MSLDSLIDQSVSEERYFDAYHSWRKFADERYGKINEAFANLEKPADRFSSLLENTNRALYMHALKTVKKHFTDVPLPYALVSLGRHLRPLEHHSDAGLFLSAAFASANKRPILYVPQVFPAVSGLGYGLPSHKTIVNNAPLVDLGEQSLGTIVNTGENPEMIFASEAYDGLYLNLGTVGKMSEFTFGGIHINHGTAQEFGTTIGISFTQAFQKGVYVNFGKVHEFAKNAYQHIHINHGDVCYFARSAGNGIQMAYKLPALMAMGDKERGSLGPEQLSDPRIAEFMEPINTLFAEKDPDALKHQLLEKFGTLEGEKIGIAIMEHIAKHYYNLEF